jgi:hypothetical protein
MSWRTIQDAMPAPNLRVLVSNGFMITIARWRRQEGWYFAGWWDDENLYLGIGAEWWQPLPALPVGEPPLDRMVREASER